VQETNRRSAEHERIPPGAGDYFIIDCGDSSWYYVSTVMARAIEGRLDRWLRPRWITFVDVTGARIRVRSRDINSIAQSTVAQREDGRVFDRNRRAEDEANRDWDNPF
jgi:hypothetical protein